jgi:transposase
LWHNQRVHASWRTTSREELLKELERRQQEIERLERARRDVERQRDRLRRERDRLRERVDRLEDELDAARRAGFRQAAPFSKGAPQAAPRRPGRKPGLAYGRKAYRAIPPRVHEHHEALLPPACPHCGGHVRRTRVARQYQEDLPPVQPIVRAFAVHIGRCADCGRRVQGRHPLQTSDALGAASAQLGPQAVALAAVLNKQLGLSVGKVTTLLRERFGLRITPGGVVQALQRAARRAQPTYTSLCDQVRGSPVVTPDETGWKVAARLHWLWAFVTPTTTVYAIEGGRGFDEAAATLGAAFDGVLVRDGWAPYRRFDRAIHQTCLAHLLRRCRTLQRDHDEHHFAPRVQAVLQAGLAVRDRWRTGTISAHGVAVARGRLANRLNTLIDDPGPHRLAQTFATHLAVEFPAVFTFLLDPSIDATNWRAEQALRPAVITRKVWGGNRTTRGAHTQHVLASVLRTIQQRDLDAAALLAEILRAPEPIVPLAVTGVPQ